MGIENKIEKDEDKKNLGKTIAFYAIAVPATVILAYFAANILCDLCHKITAYGAQQIYSR